MGSFIVDLAVEQLKIQTRPYRRVSWSRSSCSSSPPPDAAGDFFYKELSTLLKMYIRQKKQGKLMQTSVFSLQIVPCKAHSSPHVMLSSTFLRNSYVQGVGKEDEKLFPVNGRVGI